MFADEERAAAEEEEEGCVCGDGERVRGEELR